MAAYIDLSGRTFDRLRVVRRAEAAPSKTTGVRWVAQCAVDLGGCGSPAFTVNGKDLRRARTRSCGCIRIEVAKATLERIKARPCTEKPAEPDSYACQWCKTDQPADQMGPVLFAVEEGGSGMQCRDDRACTRRQKTSQRQRRAR